MSALPLQQLDLGLAQEFLPTPLPPPSAAGSGGIPHWVDQTCYLQQLQLAQARFANEPHTWTARDLTMAIFRAADAAMPPEAAFVLNSSTGKDSTLMVALFAEYVLDLRHQGLTPRRAACYISDTGSEFPAMAQRMTKECAAINEWAARIQLDFECVLVRPPPKHRLLVEIIGNGKPLPKLTNASGPKAPSAWCMDRVKAGPLTKCTEMAKAKFPKVVQCLGVRSSESAKRATTIGNYSEGLPFGLTRMGEDTSRVGLTPIAHWTTEMLQEGLTDWGVPWRQDSIEELTLIYQKGSEPNSNPLECPIKIGADGGVSTACGDLSGARYGCWMCAISRNKSLINTKNRDARYQWLWKFHNWLYRLHESNAQRVKLRDHSGFNKDTLFPRTFTFATRYWMLMLVMRAELESGFTLLQPEDLTMIETMWRRHGVHTVSTQDARQDVQTWKETGKIQYSWRCHAYDQNALGQALSEGIPSGAFFHLEQKEKQVSNEEPTMPLELAHLLALSGENFTTPISPTTMSYVFTDRLTPDRLIVMVTDTPSILGSRMHTGLLNGLHGASWKLEGIREPTTWEWRMATGRDYRSPNPKWGQHPTKDQLPGLPQQTHEGPNDYQGEYHWRHDFCGSRSFFYSTTFREETARVQNPKFSPLQQIEAHIRLNENHFALYRKCPAEPLSEHILAGQEIGELRDKLDWPTFYHLAQLTAATAGRADELTELCQIASQKAREETLHLVPDTADPGKKGQKAKEAIRNSAKKFTDLQSLLPLMLKWRTYVLQLCAQIRAGRANAALIAKLSFLARLYPVDPTAGDAMVTDLCKSLNIPLPNELAENTRA